VSSKQHETHDVAVIGGGAIGLAVAWRAAQRGLRVAVYDGDWRRGAWRAAAGMLAPVTEARLDQRELLELGLESARRWPEFADELSPSAGRGGLGYARCGTLVVARDRDEAEALERELEYRHALGLDVQRLRPSEARRLEPALAPTLRLAALVPGEQSVDPRWLLEALAAAARAAGAQLREHAPVESLLYDGDRVRGVLLARGERLEAARVVVAAGAWSGELGDVAVRPVKGQIARLRDHAGPGLLGRVVRFEGGYIVPRGDGRYVLGATVEERGFDTSVTAGALHELLRDASELVPGVLELELEELSAGLRPGTPDNLPLIGPAAEEGLLWATGHYRNGILLAPLTAERVTEALVAERVLA
jgi:glycine oxidase